MLRREPHRRGSNGSRGTLGNFIGKSGSGSNRIPSTAVAAMACTALAAVAWSVVRAAAAAAGLAVAAVAWTSVWATAAAAGLAVAAAAWTVVRATAAARQ
jgi:hypothetical protein